MAHARVHRRASGTAAVLIAAACSVVIATAAFASTPSSGTLTIYGPNVTWTGNAPGSVLQYAHFFYGGQILDDCRPQWCDTFTLTLEQPGKLEIGVEDATGYTEMQIKDAAGNEIFWSEGIEGGPTVYRATRAAAGTYTVEVMTDALAPEPADDDSYTGYAKLNDGVPAPAPEAQ